MTGGSGHTHVVGLQGGLGNQLFQYSFGTYLGAETGGEVLFDISWFSRAPSSRPLLLPRLGIHPRVRRMPSGRFHPLGRARSAAVALRWLIGPRRVVIDVSLRGDAHRRDQRPAWWYGYWQNPMIVDAAPDLRRAFAKTDAERKPRDGRIGVAVHLRRGDYALRLIPEYFLRALHLVADEHGCPVDELFVILVTDDPVAATKINWPCEMEVAQGTDPVSHFRSLASAETLILSNSTFSWWAAQLGEAARLVVAPKPWSLGRGRDDGGYLRRAHWHVAPADYDLACSP